MNEDISDYQDCFNSSWIVYQNEDEICQVQRASCYLVNTIDEHFVAKQFYSSFDVAYDQFLHGGATALLHIKESFSESCNNYLLEGPTLRSALTTSKDVDIHIDRTEWGLASDLSYQIKFSYENVAKSLLEACNISNKFLKSPVAEPQAIFGQWQWDFRIYIAHTLVAA